MPRLCDILAPIVEWKNQTAKRSAQRQFGFVWGIIARERRWPFRVLSVTPSATKKQNKVRTYTAAALAMGGFFRAFALLLAATVRCSWTVWVLRC